MKNMEWYNNLNKPFLTPPSDIFAPVWGVLYLLISISLIVYLSDGYVPEKTKGLVCFAAQLLLNFSWSWVFFGMKNIGLAFVVIVLMWLFILFTAILFYKHSKLAGILLIPYFIWVSFACYLNLSFLIIN